jgi:hypothetical protein
MNKQVSYCLRQIVGHLNRTGAPNLVIPKEAQYSNRVADDVEQYLLDIKQIFIDKCKSDPSCNKRTLEDAWNAMEGIIRRDVEKLIDKQSSARDSQLGTIASEIENDFPEAEEVRRQFMEHLKTKFLQMIRKDPQYRHQDPGKLWENFKEDITVDIKKLRD